MSGDAATAALIYLDVDDEITSVATRIRAADAETVALVLPFGSRLATSRINFRLLAREAASRGRRIEIVTADASARSLAVAAELAVHPSVAAYEAARAGVGTPTVGEGAAPPDASSEAGGNGADANGEARSPTGLWAAGGVGAAAGEGVAAGAAGVPVGGLDIQDDSATRVITVPRRRSPAVPRVGPPRPPVRTAVAVGIGLAVILLVAAGGLLALELLPSATIVLSPRAEPIRPLSLAVEARTDVTAVDPANLLVPAQLVEFDLAATYTVHATGVKVVETKATGNVTFSNFDTGSGVLIPAGTTVRTKGRERVEFATLADVTLPPAQVDFFPPFPTRPSTASVGAEAVVAGESGNVGNNAITVIPEAGRLLRVSNPEPMSGGTRTESPEISQEDVDEAVEAIAVALASDLDAKLATGTGVPPGMTTFPLPEPISPPEYSVDPATLVGSPQLAVDIVASARGTVLGVDPAPIETIARSRLELQVGEGWSLDPDSVTFTLSTPTQFAGIVTYPFTIAGLMFRDVDEAALVESIRGLILPEARTILGEYGDAQVTLWPDWVTTIPDNADRITFNLAEPALAPEPTP